MPAGSETLTKWEPVGDINFDFVSSEVYFNHSELWVRLVDGRLDVAEHRDLVSHFAAVAGYAVHEEFAHPSQGTVWSREPVISDDNKSTFPCLIVALRVVRTASVRTRHQLRGCCAIPTVQQLPCYRCNFRKATGCQMARTPIWNPGHSGTKLGSSSGMSGPEEAIRVEA